MSGNEPHHEITVLEIPQPEPEELQTAGSDVTPQAQVWGGGGGVLVEWLVFIVFTVMPPLLSFCRSMQLIPK